MPLRLHPFSLLFALALSAGLTVSAIAQERRVPSSADDIRLSYAPVVQRAAPTVVNVYAAKTVANSNPLFDDPIFRRFFGIPGGGGEYIPGDAALTIPGSAAQSIPGSAAQSVPGNSG